jgi:hypothetical protein
MTWKNFLHNYRQKHGNTALPTLESFWDDFYLGNGTGKGDRPTTVLHIKDIAAWLKATQNLRASIDAHNGESRQTIKIREVFMPAECNARPRKEASPRVHFRRGFSFTWYLHDQKTLGIL